MKHDKKLKVAGSDLIYEDLRQYCLNSMIQDWNSDAIKKTFPTTKPKILV